MKTTDEDQFNELLSLIHELRQSRDDWKELYQQAQDHARYGSNDEEREDCECPSCFLHRDYKLKIDLMIQEHHRDVISSLYGMDRLRDYMRGDE